MSDSQKTREDYNEGDKYRGEIITALYSAKPNYIIFEGDHSGEVTVATEDVDLRKRCSEIGSRISIITDYLTTKKERRKFVDQIGLAYSEAIDGDIENAKKICDKIIDRIELYKCNIGRFHYLLSCLSVVVINLIISYLLKKINITPEIVPHFYIMSFASIGGFLSVAKDIKKIHIDPSEFGLFQIFYGVIRILISMFSGLIIYILIKSELILPQLNSKENIYIVYIFAIASGFSESMIPNLLKRIEDDNAKND